MDVRNVPSGVWMRLTVGIVAAACIAACGAVTLPPSNLSGTTGGSTTPTPVPTATPTPNVLGAGTFPVPTPSATSVGVGSSPIPIPTPTATSVGPTSHRQT